MSYNQIIFQMFKKIIILILFCKAQNAHYFQCQILRKKNATAVKYAVKMQNKNK